MRILMTADTVGGVWTYALELIRALAKQQDGIDQQDGIKVLLATMGAPLSAEQQAQADGMAHLEVHQSTFKLEWMDDPWQDVQEAGDWLLGLDREFQPDIIHLNGYAHGALEWSAPVLMVGHSCVLSWWRMVRGQTAPPEWNRYREAVTDGLQAADLVVAPTRAMLDALQNEYGPLPRTQVIWNGCDLARWTPGAKDPFVFAAGRLWDEAKNISALEAAAPQIAWPIRVAGDARHPDGGQVRHRHLQTLGRLSADDLVDELRRAAIYALPARYEPFGLSALEAALCGCALVLGDIASLREVWGEAALFIPPDDHAALARTLQELIADEPRRQNMGRLARVRAEQFSATRMAAAYHNAYVEMAAVAVENRLT